MPNFKTLDSLNKPEHEEEHSDDDRQGFFVGGSDHSGQQVLGPSERDVAGAVFSGARRAGAEVLSSEESSQIHDRMSGGAMVGSAWGGTGASLSGGSRQATGQAPTASSQTVSVQITFWENGFSIDRGPLRTFDDPANKEFLRQIQMGRIPDELQRMYPGKQCDVDLVRRPGPYEKPAMMPFSGQGQRLGGN
ncbi:SEP domain protein [Aphelenchoides besseyi]|nr:SEP domain protein [Aphelenchoides besseyi]KAI6236506.1 SEP domain protein [Aphelenchoides besseyi]